MTAVVCSGAQSAMQFDRRHISMGIFSTRTTSLEGPAPSDGTGDRPGSAVFASVCVRSGGCSVHRPSLFVIHNFFHRFVNEDRRGATIIFGLIWGRGDSVTIVHSQSQESTIIFLQLIERTSS